MKNWADYFKDLKHVFEKIKQLIAQKKIQKSQIALVILSVGAIVFLSVPNGKESSLFSKNTSDSKSSQGEKKSVSNTGEEDEYHEYIVQKETELEQILCKVKDVGQVKVMITLKDSGQRIVNKDVNESEEENRWERQEQTVIMEDSSGDQNAMVTQQIQPEIMGVIVICEGGDNPQVISDVSYAVEVLFSLSAHKVKVMKMIS